MNFKCFVPYSQADLTVMEANGIPVEEFYCTLNELIESCGDVVYTEMNIEVEQIDGLEGTEFPIDYLKDN